MPAMKAGSAVLAVVAVTLFGLLMPGAWRAEVAGLFPPDIPVLKIGHLVAFAGLAFLLVRQWQWQHVAALGLVFAGATEALQFFAVDRNPSLADVGIDMAGVLLGLTLRVPSRSLPAWLRRPARP